MMGELELVAALWERLGKDCDMMAISPANRKRRPWPEWDVGADVFDVVFVLGGHTWAHRFELAVLNLADDADELLTKITDHIRGGLWMATATVIDVRTEAQRHHGRN